MRAVAARATCQRWSLAFRDGCFLAVCGGTEKDCPLPLSPSIRARSERKLLARRAGVQREAGIGFRLELPILTAPLGDQDIRLSPAAALPVDRINSRETKYRVI